MPMLTNEPTVNLKVRKQHCRRLARYVSSNRCAGNVGCSCHIFELNCGINCKWAILSCATTAFSEWFVWEVSYEECFDTRRWYLDFRIPPRSSGKCSLLGYYVANTCNFLPTFRDKLSAPFLGVVSSILLDSRPLKMGPIGCPEM